MLVRGRDRSAARDGLAASRAQALRWTGWFWIANVVLLSLIALLYDTPPARDAPSMLFRVLMFPAQFTLLSALPFAVVAAGAARFPGRAARRLAIALAIGMAAVVLIDTRVYALYRFHLNGMVWSLLTSGVSGDVLPFSHRTLLASGLALALLAALEILLGRRIWRAVRSQHARASRTRSWGLRAALAGLVWIAAAQGLHVWADAAGYSPILRQVRALPWLRPLTAHTLLARMGWLPAESEVRLHLAARHGSELLYPRRPLTCAAPPEPLNILIVVIEEWRHDEFSERNTPRLWDLGRRSLRFGNHWSSGSATRHGLFGLLYGLDASYWDAMLAEQRGPLLVHEALIRGDAFGVYASAPLLFPEFDRTVFSEIRERIPLATPGADSAQRDRHITDDFLGFLEENRAPFFGFLFYDSPHALAYPSSLRVPFTPVAEERHHLELGPDTDSMPLLNRHHNAVYSVDRLVGEVIDALENRGLLETTTLIVTGDHGEEFNDSRQNYWGHNSNFSRHQLQVPLLAHLPGHAARVVARMTSHVDVAPTLLQTVFGCSNPPGDYSNGQSLLDDSPRSHVVASGNHLGIGIIEAARTTQLAPWGGLSIFDHHLQPIPGSEPDYALISEVLAASGRFYRSNRSSERVR